MNKLIEINNLTVKYGNNIAIADLSLIIEEGIYLAILGPNGSGKSTLLKSILGLIQPSSGEIKILGKFQDKIDPKVIGYVPQIKTLDKTFPALAIELVLSGLSKNWVFRSSKQDKIKALKILEQLNSVDIAYRHLSELSGGQLQKIYLARSLVRNPKILLLDEPATGVDFVCETNFNSILSEYAEQNQMTIIMVTHDWTSAYHHSTHILLLNNHLIYFGTKENAFTDDNIKHTFSHLAHKHNVTFTLKAQ